MFALSFRRSRFVRRHARALALATACVAALALLILAFGPLAPSVSSAPETVSLAAAPSVDRADALNILDLRHGTGGKSGAPRSASSSPSLLGDAWASLVEAGNGFFVSQKKLILAKGDTLAGLLIRKAALSQEEAHRVVAALSKVYNPRDIAAGREITVFFHNDPAAADPRFSGLSLDKDTLNTVSVSRDDTGVYKVNKREKQVHSTLRAFRGRIDDSLYADARAAGVPDTVILDIIKMYSWNVDFQREIHTGDRFEVLYEEYRTDDNKIVRGRGNILYAKLVLGGEDMPFYRFEDRGGEADYYDASGRSAKRPLMKTPIDGARLSSGFGMRTHPVLGYSKMHTGVDFAAPRGTPIYAAGSGTVVRAGPFSSYGNYVRLRHRTGLDTAYAHMSRVKPGLRAGARVKQGEVIGYVGTTGRSTGPHLHYEVLVNNAPVNPAAVKLPTGRELKGADLKAFKRLAAQVRSKFSDIGRATVVAQAQDVSRGANTVAN